MNVRVSNDKVFRKVVKSAKEFSNGRVSRVRFYIDERFPALTILSTNGNVEIAKEIWSVAIDEAYAEGYMDMGCCLVDDNIIFDNFDFNSWGNKKRVLKLSEQYSNITFDLRYCQPIHVNLSTITKKHIFIDFIGGSFICKNGIILNEFNSTHDYERKTYSVDYIEEQREFQSIFDYVYKFRKHIGLIWHKYTGFSNEWRIDVSCSSECTANLPKIKDCMHPDDYDMVMRALGNKWHCWHRCLIQEIRKMFYKIRVRAKGGESDWDSL